MRDKRGVTAQPDYAQIMSAFVDSANAAENLDFSVDALGQRCPNHCPQHCPHSCRADLGEPMTIPEVAAILGCSVWTIRQKYIPQGLPHVRASKAGKLMFFRHQVIDWILKRQQKKGGNRP